MLKPFFNNFIELYLSDSVNNFLHVKENFYEFIQVDMP